jgi:hypothetical protein
MKPSVGRIVHYVSEEGEHLAAIITRTHGVLEMVDLTCFYPEATARTISGGETHSRVPFDEKTFALRSWHWPERVE